MSGRQDFPVSALYGQAATHRLHSFGHFGPGSSFRPRSKFRSGFTVLQIFIDQQCKKGHSRSVFFGDQDVVFADPPETGADGRKFK